MLVELLGGELKLRSELNKGCTFSFVLTLPRKEVVITENVPDNLLHFSLTGKRILLAEDNHVNMLVGKKFLQKWGATVVEAANGKIAVEVFCNSNTYDLVLLDLEMPEMDGYQALAEIRKLNSTVPIIAFTAAIFEGMEQSLQASGFTDFIQKPFKPEQLQSTIARYI
jgi:CheY-like chemotaxis protein